MKKSKKIKQLKAELKTLKRSNQIGGLIKLAVYTTFALGYYFVTKKLDLPDMSKVEEIDPQI